MRAMVLASGLLCLSGCATASRSAFTIRGADTEALARTVAAKHSFGAPEEKAPNTLVLMAPHAPWVLIKWASNAIVFEGPADDVEVLVVSLVTLACDAHAEVTVLRPVPSL